MNPEDHDIYERPSLEENDDTLTQKFSKDTKEQIQYGTEQSVNIDLDFAENENHQSPSHSLELNLILYFIY